MIRLLTLAAALIATPAFASERAAFDMFGLRTTETYSGEMSVAGKKCNLKARGEEECFRFGGTKIGTVVVMKLTSKFNDGKLYSISGITTFAYALDLRNAFSAKYGEPDMNENTPVQNLMGATFTNAISQWVFADGILILKERGSHLDFAAFEFVARQNLPERLKQGQPVNF